TAAIMSHVVLQRLNRTILTIFGAGLLADTLGTVFLCVLTVKGWRWTFHSEVGLTAWAIMALHFVWAVGAIKDMGNSKTYFDRFSPVAWYVWVIAFATGIPINSAGKCFIALGIMAIATCIGIVWWVVYTMG